MSLQNEFNFIEFAQVSFFFFEINGKILKSKSLVEQKKLYKFFRESKTENDTEKIIFNFLKYVSDIDKKLLSKGFNFCIPPEQLKCANNFVHFELLSRDIHYLGILSMEDLDFAKS